MEAIGTDQRDLAHVAWQQTPLPTLIFTIDAPAESHPALIVAQANPAAEELFGSTELAGAEIGELFARDNPRSALREVRAAMHGGREHTAELAWNDGTQERWLAITFRPISILDGASHLLENSAPPAEVTVVATAVDVTQRHNSEVSLRESEAVLRLATSAGGVGTWTLNIGTGALVVDSMAARIASVSTQKIRTMADLMQRVHPADRGLFDDADLLRTTGITCRIMDDDAVARTVLIRGRAFGSGAHARVAGTIIDISATHDLASRLNETLESISDAYFATDEQWHVTYANRHAERLLGQPLSEIIGAVLWDLFSAENSSLETNLRHAMETRTPMSMEGSYVPRGAWYEVRAFPLQGGLSIYFSDITDRKSVEQQRDRLLASEREARLRAEEARKHIAFQARHDALTGLVNRGELARRLDQFLGDDAGTGTAVMFVDIDHFKWVNDSLGHAFGDHLLVELADRFVPLVREGDVVARFGGDEFVVVLFDSDAATAEAVAERLAAAARKTVEFDGRSINITVSIGLALQDGEASAESLISDADIALYRAKDEGRNQVAWFHVAARDALAERARVETELRAGLERGEVMLHYQPSWDLTTGKIVDLEALARWRHPEAGLLGANDFVPSLDRTSLLVDLGNYVVRAAIAEAAQLRDFEDLTVWINVSPRQLIGPGLAQMLLQTLREHNLPTARIGVEIVETALVEAAA
ncbi:MAG TPA: diguanylate cyclase, partial [Actinomycetales bacterium]|nr:diguanylate cyclase [Actinomycetales bacterium]